MSDQNQPSGVVSDDTAAALADRLSQAILALRDCVEFRDSRCGGVPVLKGTRFPVAHVLAQWADGDSLAELAENFELEERQLCELLHALTAILNRPADAHEGSAA